MSGMLLPAELVPFQQPTHAVNFTGKRTGPSNRMAYAVMMHEPAHEIVPGLWLGNRTAALDPEFHRTNRIRAVFNCSKDIPFEASVKRRYRVPVDDNLEDAEIRNLELWSFELVYKIAAELRQARSDSGAILVHCAAGMQRSAASVAMYLVATQNMKTEDAITFIQSKRSIAFRPSANFERSIRGFERAFNQEIRPHLASGGSNPLAPGAP